MLTSIRLENFKCFELLERQPRRITVLIGPNGAGKSSVIQALMFLRQSLGCQDPQWQGPFVNLVGFTQALRSGATNEELSIAIEGERALNGKRLTFKYRAEFSEVGLLANIARFDWGGYPFYAGWRRGEPQDQTIVGRNHRGVIFSGEGMSVIGDPHGSASSNVGRGMSPDEAEVADRMRGRSLTPIPDALRSWRFGPPVRGFLQHGYELAPSALDEIHPAASLR